MTYEGVAALLIRFAALALIIVQALGLIGGVTMMVSSPVAVPLGAVFGTMVLNVVAGVILFSLSRPLGRFLAHGLSL